MGTYIKVVSSVKPINKISVLVNGVIKNIKSGWVFVNGQRKQVFPTTEAWTEIYNKGTPGSYSQTLGFGKYRIVMSGGGGAGGVAVNHDFGGDKSATNGSAGELQSFYFDVADGTTTTVSGVVGAGASFSDITTVGTDVRTTVGTPGTGYASGTSGESKSSYQAGPYASVSGSGGGSTNANVGGTNHIAKGGNGGAASEERHSGTRQPGIGGSGGTSSGTGASGGVRRTGMTHARGGSGSKGDVRIYKSNFYPA